MADLFGFISIALVSLITYLVARLYPEISKILFTALILRILFMLIGHYIIPLPDSTADARSFENAAWEIGQNGFFNLLDYYPGPDSRFISWLIAIPYSLFGRSELMAKSISLFLGMGCVFLGWKLANVLWDSKAANKSGWAIALFPSLILYSVLVMREVYICFFILVALHGIVNWVKTDNFKSIILAIMGFIGATFFHGAMMIGLITFLTITGIIIFKRLFKLLINYRINLKFFIFLLLLVFITELYLSNKINVQYLGTFESTSSANNLQQKINSSTRGVASYPEWAKVNSLIEMPYKIPARAIYFIFSPFPWDVKEPKHLIGMIDGFLYMYLVFLVICNIKVIWKDPALKIILIILLSYILIFAVGVGNFGTGIRHRSKFVIILLILVAPLIHKLVFRKKIYRLLKN